MKIRNLFISLVLILALLGCDKYGRADRGQITYEQDGIVISVIDGCEYITEFGIGARQTLYTHKANCKNCEERKARKELEELKTNPKSSPLRQD